MRESYGKYLPLRISPYLAIVNLKFRWQGGFTKLRTIIPFEKLGPHILKACKYAKDKEYNSDDNKDPTGRDSSPAFIGGIDEVRSNSRWRGVTPFFDHRSA